MVEEREASVANQVSKKRKRVDLMKLKPSEKTSKKGLLQLETIF